MANKIPPLRPYMMFTDDKGNLTKDAYDFLQGLFMRVGGTLSNLNAASLQDYTWAVPAAIGTTTPNTGKFTTLYAGAFGCNNAIPQTAKVVPKVATTASTSTTPYGYTTAAQANDIVTKLNLVIDALVANGILSLT